MTSCHTFLHFSIYMWAHIIVFQNQKSPWKKWHAGEQRKQKIWFWWWLCFTTTANSTNCLCLLLPLYIFYIYFHFQQGHVWIYFHHTNSQFNKKNTQISQIDIFIYAYKYIYFLPPLFIFYFVVHAYLLTEPKGNHVKSEKKCFIQLDSWAIYITIPIKCN